MLRMLRILIIIRQSLACERVRAIVISNAFGNRKNKLMKLVSILLVSLLLFGKQASATIIVPHFFADSMVLQRDQKVPVWGWGEMGEVVKINFNHKEYSEKVGADKKWKVYLPATKVGGPYDLIIKGKENQIVLKEVLFGDVWVCGGQSNMEFYMREVKDKYASEIANSTNSNIRLFDVKHNFSFIPLDTCTSKINGSAWVTAYPGNVENFSAVAYFFAREINAKYHIPIGLLNCNWGGTPAEAWISEETLKDFPNYAETFKYISNPDNQKLEKEKVGDRLKEWVKGLADNDVFYKYNKQNWQSSEADTIVWKKITLPQLLDDVGVNNFTGVVWFKKEIQINKDLLNQKATLHLGNIDDIDSTFINGKLVGYTNYTAKERVYNIPASLLKEGANIISVRMVNIDKTSGFVKGKPLDLSFANGISIPLNNEWNYAPTQFVKPVDKGKYDKLNIMPSALYDGMLHSIIGYGIKGVIWYQGESNSDRAKEYRTLFPTLITNWQKDWNQGVFPFLFVQLANYMKPTNEPTESNWAALREAQRLTLSLPNTGMAIIHDLGEAYNIHPKNKKDVGLRLALLAKKIAYVESGIVSSGPLYDTSNTVGNKIIVQFKECGSGLVANDGRPLKYFAIAGADKKFVWANAVIKGNSVEVWSDKIEHPVAVRYAWSDNPVGANLYNKEGLPASSFRTDIDY